MTAQAENPVDVYVSVGSNIRPEENIRLTVDDFRENFGDLQLSRVYRSHPVGFEGNDFLNMVIGFSTREAPEDLLDHFEELHRAAHRVRQTNPYSPRTLDLDLLLYGDMVNANLKLPHRDIEKYAFVAGPLAELAPELEHPVSGKTMGELWESFGPDDQDLQPVTLVLN